MQRSIKSNKTPTAIKSKPLTTPKRTKSTLKVNKPIRTLSQQRSFTTSTTQLGHKQTKFQSTTIITPKSVHTQQFASFSTGDKPGFFSRMKSFFTGSKPATQQQQQHPTPTTSTTTSKPTSTPPPKSSPTPSTQASKPQQTTSTPPPSSSTTTTSSSTATTSTTSGELPQFTNRPLELEGIPKATGKFVKFQWEQGKVPDMSKFPALSGKEVTDGKVIFDQAALTIPGVFPTRDEEVAQLQKALDLKKDAAKATETANTLHGEANKLYDAGDKAGNKTKMAESKEYRVKAQQIHQESFDLAYAGAMSMAIKALYSKLPSVDYHVFLVDPYEASLPIVLQMMKTGLKFPRKDICIIQGAGQHSDKEKGAQIPVHFVKYLAENKIANTKLTEGSYVLQLDSIKKL